MVACRLGLIADAGEGIEPRARNAATEGLDVDNPKFDIWTRRGVQYAVAWFEEPYLQ